jgi:diadenylate cyclase
MMETTGAKARKLTHAMLMKGSQLAAHIGAKALFTFLDAVADTDVLKQLPGDGTELILVTRKKAKVQTAEAQGYRHISIPSVTLTRMGQIKTAVIIAFSQRMLDTGDTVVFVVGPVGGSLDTLMVMRVGDEWEMFHTENQPRITEHIKRVVFEQALTLALELAAEGREGRPVGALFIVGDYRNVVQHREQTIINPFKGYSERTRNILDESMRETVKNFAKLDGAFIVKGNGVIVSAGSHLKTVKPPQPLPPGLGSRHAAAAGITAITKSIAITLSESTGTVRIWRRGQIITEIERPSPNVDHGPLSGFDKADY